MKEVYPNLWVGDQECFKLVEHQPGWATVHACKEPYHRRALGYSGKAAPKNNPEYLVAIRGSEMSLNMIDAHDPAYIPKSLVNTALAFISDNLDKGLKVLLHCNQGMSRSPGIALLFLARKGKFSGLSYDQAKVEFQKIYPNFFPAGGVDGFCRLNWEAYQEG
ncbi:MAG: phosphatase [Clostridia bacterium]|jgi:hypothetical protein